MKLLRAMVRYIITCTTWTRNNPRYFHPISWIRDFPRWFTYRVSQETPLDRKQPWICYSAVRELQQIVQPDTRVFEYGSGGSTLFFATHCAEVVAVDHDPKWGKMVNDALQENKITNVQVLTIPGEPPAAPGDAESQSGYGSDHPGHETKSYKAYVQSLTGYPKGHFNLIVVDGRARSACVKQACEYIAPGGVIIVDNSDRHLYDKAQEQCFGVGWSLKKFAGPLHGWHGFNATNIWTNHVKG